MSKTIFVQNLPDLLHYADYVNDPESKKMRIRIRMTDDGVDILGDAQRPDVLDDLLEGLGPDAVEKVLCG